MIDRRFLNIRLAVQGVANEPPENLYAGMQYIVGENPSGDFASAEQGALAYYDSENWTFIMPKVNGMECLNLETQELLKFDGMLWETIMTFNSGSGSSVLYADDLVKVVTQESEITQGLTCPFLYVIDNGINIPHVCCWCPIFARYEYSYTSDDNKMIVDSYQIRVEFPKNSILVAVNANKYYTIKFDGEETYVEASDVPNDTLVLNKRSNFFYHYKGESLTLLNDSKVFNVNYIGDIDTTHSTDEPEYYKYFGKLRLVLHSHYGTSFFMRTSISYDGWTGGLPDKVKEGELFASTNENNCFMYCCIKKNTDEEIWEPIAKIEEGIIVFNQYDKKLYSCNGVTLSPIEEKRKLIVVTDVCDVSFVKSQAYSSSEFTNKKAITNEGIEIYNAENEMWETYSASNYGDRYLILSDISFNENSSCLYEYTEEQGNIDNYTCHISRYELVPDTTFLNKANGKMYYYDGTKVKIIGDNNG